MRVLIQALLVSVVWLVVSCGQKSANLQEGAVAPDTTLFENGMKYLEKSQFIKARLAFQTLINTYPDSEFTPVALLSIGDSFYAEGGTENLLQAQAQYKDFIIFYPTHERADDAQMKIAAVSIRLMRAPDRDPTFARKAAAELEKFLNEYPDSELAPTALEFVVEVSENLATGVHMVGNFYFERGAFRASESRYKEVVQNWDDFSGLDETLFLLARSLEEMGRIEEASAYYGRLASEYPFSEYFDPAKGKLVLLEKQVPPVDEAKAERNLANRREESFSFWDPIRSVWRTFAGRADPYEVARRRAEERRVQRITAGKNQARPNQ